MAKKNLLIYFVLLSFLVCWKAVWFSVTKFVNESF